MDNKDLFLSNGRDSSLHHIQNSYGDYSASHPMGARGSFPSSKVVSLSNQTLYSIQIQGLDCMTLHIHGDFPDKEVILPSTQTINPVTY
jgi:hypothetical protein